MVSSDHDDLEILPLEDNRPTKKTKRLPPANAAKFRRGEAIATRHVG